MPFSRICLIIVAFRPEIDVLNRVISSIFRDVEKIYIYDNTDVGLNLSIDDFNFNVPIKLFGTGDNIGIAAAQNFFLKEAVAEGFDFVVMSDQDTIFPACYVADLARHCFTRNDVAAVFPGWLDINLQGEAKYPGQYIFDSRNRLRIDLDQPDVLEISHAISSGMMINLRNLRRVGLMRDDLFIDWVDNEWCWRARASGFVLLAVPAVKIRHTLGDCTVKVFGKNFVKRGMARNYYIVRNALYLIFYSRIPSAAKTYLAKKAIHHTVFSLIASGDKFAVLRCLAKAWLHGLQAKLGKFS
jgi:rhamnosyltransferase